MLLHSFPQAVDELRDKLVGCSAWVDAATEDFVVKVLQHPPDLLVAFKPASKCALSRPRLLSKIGERDIHGVELIVHLAPHPRLALFSAHRRKLACLDSLLVERDHLLPRALDPRLLQCRDANDLGAPETCPWLQKLERGRVLELRYLRRVLELACTSDRWLSFIVAVCVCIEHTIGLGDNDQVGQLHDTALDALQLIAACRRHQQHKHIHHIGDHRLGLPHAHRLHQHNVVSGGCFFE